MTGPSLRDWGDLEDRRRRSVRSGLGAVPSYVYSVVSGALLAALVARGLGAFGGEPTASDYVGIHRTWLAVVIASHVIVMFGAPFRMYWRRDSAFLARLPIAGDALFRLALVRSVRATALVALPCALGALAFGPWVTWEIALRHLGLVGVAACGAGLLAPAVALAAGSVVASDKAEALMKNLGGELQAPKTSWLGILPGLAATAVVLILIAGSEWSLGSADTAIGDPLLVLVVAVATCVAAIGWALASAKRVMLAALREVSALDQERLAHVDRTKPSVVERAWGGMLPGGARLVFEKDAMLARRRFPIPYFLGMVGVLVMWIVAAAAPSDMLTWAGVATASIGVYGVVMARRRITPPIEHPGFLRTLAVSAAGSLAAKRAQSVLWVVIYLVLGAVPIAIRAHDPVRASITLGVIIAAATIVSLAVVQRIRAS